MMSIDTIGNHYLLLLKTLVQSDLVMSLKFDIKNDTFPTHIIIIDFKNLDRIYCYIVLELIAIKSCIMVPFLDYTTVFKPHIIIFQIFGFWKPQGGMKFKKIYSLMKYLNFMISISFSISEFSFMYLNRTNIDEITSIMFFAISLLLNLTRLLVLYKNMDRLQVMLADFNQPLFRVKNVKQYKMAKKSLKFAAIYFYTCLFLGSATILFTAFVPFFGEERVQYETGAYPFDWRVSPNYELLYIYQFFVMAMNSLTCLNQDALYATLTTQVGIQCDLLCDILNNLESYEVSDGLLHEIDDDIKPTKRENTDTFSEKMTENLVVCVKYHKQVLQ